MNLEKMILIDLETGGLQPENGIYEAALLAIENGKIVDKLHIGIVDNPEKNYYPLASKADGNDEVFVRQN